MLLCQPPTLTSPSALIATNHKPAKVGSWRASYTTGSNFNHYDLRPAYSLPFSTKAELCHGAGKAETCWERGSDFSTVSCSILLVIITNSIRTTSDEAIACGSVPQLVAKLRSCQYGNAFEDLENQIVQLPISTHLTSPRKFLKLITKRSSNMLANTHQRESFEATLYPVFQRQPDPICQTRCHICSSYPRFKTELKFYSDCERCGKRSCTYSLLRVAIS